jgi:hypothetical protein
MVWAYRTWVGDDLHIHEFGNLYTPYQIVLVFCQTVTKKYYTTKTNTRGNKDQSGGVGSLSLSLAILPLSFSLQSFNYVDTLSSFLFIYMTVYIFYVVCLYDRKCTVRKLNSSPQRLYYRIYSFSFLNLNTWHIHLRRKKKLSLLFYIPLLSFMYVQCSMFNVQCAYPCPSLCCMCIFMKIANV